MDLTKPIHRCSNMAVVCLLVLLTLSVLKFPYDPPLLAAEAAGSPSSLKGFAVVPDTVAVIDNRYVIALLKNVEEDLYAIIMFTANCRSGDCTIENLVAYSIFDAQGKEVQLAMERQG